MTRRFFRNSHGGGSKLWAVAAVVVAVAASVVVPRPSPLLRLKLAQRLRVHNLDWLGRAAPSATEQMSAVAYERHGNVSVLQYHRDSYPRPALPENGGSVVLIRVHYSAINPCDFKFRRNPLPSWLLPKPKIPGGDVAGVVVQVVHQGGDDDNNKFRVGDRVAALLPLLGSQWGAAAEYVAVPADLVAKVGDDTSLQAAASVPLVGLTVVQALHHVAQPLESKRILIHAGAGGVGSFAIQYAKRVLGMHVLATASSAKADMLRDLGCDEVIDYTTQRFEEAIAGPVDVVLDPMSWDYEKRTLGRSVPSVVVLSPKKGGHYLNIFGSDWSFADGRERANGWETIENWLLSKLGILGLRYSLVAVQPNGAHLQGILNMLNQGTLQPVIDRVYPLEQVQEAYLYLEQGHSSGKILLDHTATVPEEQQEK